jgi:hypothetical protein
MWDKLKKLTGYTKEAEIEYTRTQPVRGPDGKPAKHLEVMETGKKLHITEGWFRKSTKVVEP